MKADMKPVRYITDQRVTMIPNDLGEYVAYESFHRLRGDHKDALMELDDTRIDLTRCMAALRAKEKEVEAAHMSAQAARDESDRDAQMYKLASARANALQRRHDRVCARINLLVVQLQNAGIVPVEVRDAASGD